MSSFSPAAPSAPAFDLEVSDRGQVANRLIRRANLALRAVIRPATVSTLAQLAQPANQRRLLFVVGAGRCGTTALQTALNASDEVFLLGEANFFWENLRPGFRARYNRKHRAFGFPPGKLNDCPAVAPESGTWIETVAALASQHRFVGEKVAFGAHKADRWPSEFLAFHRRYFREAAYILAFRNPRDAILSVRSTWGFQNLVPWTRSYIAAQRCLIRLRRNFPRTVPVFLETIGPATFQGIEQCLDWPLPQLSAVLVRKEHSPRGLEEVPSTLRKTVADLEALYPALSYAVSNSGARGSDAAFDSIDARLTDLHRGLDWLHYSVEARLARLRSRVVTASRMARDWIRSGEFG
jgi:hypothetical protein